MSIYSAPDKCVIVIEGQKKIKFLDTEEIIFYTRASQLVTSLSHFRLTETVTIFMPCFNTCFIPGYKIGLVSSHSLIRY